MFATWFFVKRKKKFSIFKDLGIPGPPPSFISGNLSEILDKGAAAAFNEWIEKYGDYVGFFNGAYPCLIVKDLELIKNIQIKDFSNFHRRGVFSGFARVHPIDKLNLINTTGQRWKEMRSLITPAFATSNMKKMASLMEDSTDEFLSVVECLRLKSQSFEARELFQRLSADVIFRSAFGLKSGLQQRTASNKTAESLFQGSIGLLKMFKLSWRGYLFTCFPEFGPLWRVILWLTSRYNKPVTDMILDDVTPIVQYRRENRNATRTDFLQQMLNAEADEGAPVNENSLATGDAERTTEGNDAQKLNTDQKTRGLTNAEIVANGLLFFVAGFETTGTAMSFLAYALARHEDVQERLRKEVLAVLERDGAFTYDNVFGIKYLDQVISESLRYQPSVVGFITRTGTHDYVHNNKTVPAGISILVPSYYMSRDATYWAEPGKFDPDRFATENKSQIDPTVYQPFGQGPRSCIGMRFAQMEMKLTMAKTLAKYRFVLDDRHVKEKELKIGSSFLFAYPEDGIWLKIEEV
ncbi:hypothetical protein V5799_007315 [Amblyomma americanum]|uniref:Cytochrome n=1 Tax=Amblyomma americanum TaxID=6943 RepID=A0AAQ4DTW2_AMBAM